MSEPPSPPAILQDLRTFREMGSVLYVAAHPDDENTQLITYLARGRGYRTAYLSLTRGDGGQNVLGPEFGAELGVARTQELLAARRLDGGRQFFTRAMDFGFSKSAEETLRIWDKKEVLGDIVRVIRVFRPDVIITRFSPRSSGTHGHHTASAVLALEAFKLAGDPKAYPEQLGELTPWQPRRILMNGGGFGRGAAANNADTLHLDISGDDPVSGEPFGAIAGRSRAMHKTQGFGNFGGGGRGARAESFSLLDGEPATKDILEGVDTTWARIPGGAEIDKLAAEAIEKFNAQDPAASVPALLVLHQRLAALPADPLVSDKRGQLVRILQACLGLSIETVVPQAEVVPGESLKLHCTTVVRSTVPVRWRGMRYPDAKKDPDGRTFLLSVWDSTVELKTGQPASHDVTKSLPTTTPLSQPYWLREDPTPGMFRVSDVRLIGRPENPPVLPVEQEFEVGGQTLLIPDEPVQVTGGKRRRLDVIPPVSLSLTAGVQLFAPGASRPVGVEVTAARTDAFGHLKLDAPTGWKVEPPTQEFALEHPGDKAKFTFTVTAPAKPGLAEITARAQTESGSFSSERIEINYPHIPLQLLQPPARLKAVALELAVRGHRVGYLTGAGDSVAEALEQMGYSVTRLTPARLTPEKLAGFDAVVVGIRAFDTKKDLSARLPALFDYVETGGNVIMQYNRTDGLLDTPLTLKVSQSRVTDENAPVTFLAPEHPALTTPNRITSADFDGWIQERGIYFPSQWDDRFTPILACNDPGEAPLKSGLLVAKLGRGYFVYTSLVFFRELPAGVPGAYRLFANLVSLGK